MKPEHPDTIVIRNEYYSSGLTEIDVWNHYQKYKYDILKEVAGKILLLFIYVGENEYIVRRSIKNRPIELTRKNYDKIITGRTVSISIEPGNRLDYLCIDIDPDSNVNEKIKKKAVDDILDLYNSMLEVQKTRVISTSNGYHVYGYLRKSVSNDVAINLVKKHVKMEFGNKYNIGAKKSSTHDINLDLTPMYYRGSHVAPYALTRNGLIAMDITSNWKRFNRRDAIIK